MLIANLYSMIVFVVVERNFRRMVSKFKLSAKYLHSLRLSLTIFFVVSFAFCKNFPIIQLSISSLMLIASFCFDQIAETLEQRVFRENLILFLENIFLSIKAGDSLQKAVLDAPKSMQGWSFEIFKRLGDEICLKDHRNDNFPGKIGQIAIELRSLNQSKANLTERIFEILQREKILQNFRRRSGQSSFQARAQAVVMTFLYIGCAFLMIEKFGWNQTRWSMMTSFPIFIIGLLLVLMMGRKIDWKI